MNREELIQAYSRNKLDKEQKAEFDRLFKTDREFREEVAFHQDMKTAFSAIERERLKAKLQEFESEVKTPPKKKFTPWLAAACVLLVVGIGWITFFANSSSPDKLYMAYFEPYENVVAPITRGESIETLKKEVFFDYEKGEYQKAAAGFKSLFQKTQAPYYLLYQANALMAAGEVEKSVPVLREHIKHKDRFLEKSRWYLALAYLKINKTKNAKEVLGKIVEKKSYKFPEAKAILEELE